MADTIAPRRAQAGAPADPRGSADPLTALHGAAEEVRQAWDRLASVSDDTPAKPGAEGTDTASARRYIAALWHVQSAEEDYLRLRERLLGA
jgi:hypothetical protein